MVPRLLETSRLEMVAHPLEDCGLIRAGKSGICATGDMIRSMTACECDACDDLHREPKNQNLRAEMATLVVY